MGKARLDVCHANTGLRAVRFSANQEDQILESHIIGSTLQQLSFPYRGEELAGLARDFIERISTGEYPDLVDHVKKHLDPLPGGRTGFEFALDLILDGLERAQDVAESGPQSRIRVINAAPPKPAPCSLRN